MKKKTIALLLVVAVLLMCLCGCGTKESNPYSSVSSGDTIKFGTYNGRAIEWLVLGVHNGRATLVSKYILGEMPWTNNATGSLVTWKSSYIRQFLNGSFYNTAFTEDEKSYIVGHSYEMGGEKTTDNVGILTAGTLMGLDDYEAKTVLGKSTAYWMCEYSTGDRQIRVVDQNGNSYKGVAYENLATTKLGVRPVIYITTGIEDK